MNKYMHTSLIIVISLYSLSGYCADKNVKGKLSQELGVNKNIIKAVSITKITIEKVAKSHTSEEYYRYLGNHPQNAKPGWHEDVQGVTHDDNYWFITQSDTGEADEQVLWKIPVGHNLKVNARSNPNTITREIRSYPQLNGYNHFGDLDYYKYRNTGFLIVGLSGDNIAAALAVFRADNLAYVAHTTDLPNAVSPGWVAIDPNSFIYFPGKASSGAINDILKYRIDWNQLYESGCLKLTFQTIIILYNESGERLPLSSHQGGQGGVFSPSGNLFYLVTGYLSDTDRAEHGIHVFDTNTWRRVKKSTNGKGQFNYEFHPGAWPFGKMQEPEGLTIWDLDDGRAPGIRGQLHVLILDNDWPSADEIYFKHYTYVQSTQPPKPKPPCPEGQKCCEPLPKGKCRLCAPIKAECP